MKSNGFVVEPGAPPPTGRIGTTKIWGKRRVTIPESACEAAGLEIGDRLVIEADGDGRLVIEADGDGRLVVRRIEEPARSESV